MTRTTLRLNYGSSTLDLNDGTLRLVEGWVPRVARRQRSALGYGMYEDVVESIPLHISADSVTEALSTLREMVRVLEQVQSWAAGEDVSPVLLEYAPRGSSLSSPARALVLGVAEGVGDILQLPASYNRALNNVTNEVELGIVNLSLIRRGSWLGSAASGSVAAVSNPAVLSVDLAQAQTIPGPLKVTIDDIAGGTAVIGSGYLLVSDADASNFTLYDVSSMSSSEFSSVSDTAKNAVGGSVMRIDAATNQNGTLTVSGVSAAVSRVTIFAALRNNSAATTWNIRAASTGFASIYGRWLTIDADNQNPRIVNLGEVVSASREHSNIAIEVQTSGVTGTLDVNYLVVFPHNETATYLGVVGGNYSSASYARQLQFDPRALTHQTPLVYVETV